MIEPFERTIYIGNEAGLQEHHITVEIKFDGKRLSITGDISNRSKTQLYAYGQINMSIDPKRSTTPIRGMKPDLHTFLPSGTDGT